MVDRDDLDVLFDTVPDGMDAESYIAGGLAVLKIVDPIHVVHCKYCKHRKEKGAGYVCTAFYGFEPWVGDEFFCGNWEERKEE